MCFAVCVMLAGFAAFRLVLYVVCSLVAFISAEVKGILRDEMQ